MNSPNEKARNFFWYTDFQNQKYMSFYILKDISFSFLLKYFVNISIMHILGRDLKVQEHRGITYPGREGLQSGVLQFFNGKIAYCYFKNSKICMTLYIFRTLNY